MAARKSQTVSAEKGAAFIQHRRRRTENFPGAAIPAAALASCAAAVPHAVPAPADAEFPRESWSRRGSSCALAREPGTRTWDLRGRFPRARGSRGPDRERASRAASICDPIMQLASHAVQCTCKPCGPATASRQGVAVSCAPAARRPALGAFGAASARLAPLRAARPVVSRPASSGAASVVCSAAAAAAQPPSTTGLLDAIPVSGARLRGLDAKNRTGSTFGAGMSPPFPLEAPARLRVRRARRTVV